MVGSRPLADRVRDALADRSPLREVRMFGGLSFLVNEKIVVCVRGGGDLLVRADPDRADELLTLDGAHPAEMGAGRAMSRSWVSVDQQAIGTDEGLDYWLGVALEYNDKQRRSPAR